MARLPALIDAIAAHDQRSRGYLDYYARHLRAGGFILSNKSGAGSASMTFRDAARLLMAVSGAVAASEVQETMETMASLTRARLGDETERLKDADLSHGIRWIGQTDTFEEAIEALIAHAPFLALWEGDYIKRWKASGTDELAEVSMQRQGFPGGQAAALIAPSAARVVRVVTYAPGVAAEIHLGRPWKAVEEDDAFHGFYTAAQTPEGFEPRSSLICTEIGVPTLLALHDAVQAPTLYPRQKPAA